MNKPGEVKEQIVQHMPALYRFALKLTRNRMDAEDLLSETIAKAIEKLNSLKSFDKMKSWLFRIMNNFFIDDHRQKKNLRLVELPQQADDIDGFSLYEQLGNSTLAGEDNPEKTFIHKLMDEDIKKAIETLAYEFRIALVLCDVEGFSYADIAVVLQVPIGTVRSRIARARALLQKELWMHALEMGIVRASATKNKKETLCDCGEPVETDVPNTIIETKTLNVQ